MMMYVVFRYAVYRHQCGGVFSTLEKAKDAVTELLATEPDTHHQYEIVPFEVDAITRHVHRTQRYNDEGLYEADAVFNTQGDKS